MGKDRIEEVATLKAIEESRQEAGIEIHDPKLLAISRLGATVEWDLYVFVVTDWHFIESGQDLEEHEQIEANNWFGFSEAITCV